MAFSRERSALSAPAPARTAGFWAEVLWLEVRDADGVFEVVGSDPSAEAVLRFDLGDVEADVPANMISIEVTDLDLVRAGLASRRWPFLDGETLRFTDPDGRTALVTRRRPVD